MFRMKLIAQVDSTNCGKTGVPDKTEVINKRGYSVCVKFLNFRCAVYAVRSHGCLQLRRDCF